MNHKINNGTCALQDSELNLNKHFLSICNSEKIEWELLRNFLTEFTS